MTADTTGVLVFTGLFAAIVAAFIIESYKNLQPNPADTTVVILAQLSQQLATSTNTTPSPFSSLANDATTDFHPPTSAVRVNILWFLSLLLSVSCALAATLMQQWTRKYLLDAQSAQRDGAPQRRGHVHAYLFMGLQTFKMKSAVEALPALLHTSVALFFVGLVDFLFSVNTTVAQVILGFAVAGATVYLALTFLPFVSPNAPYATPLS
ncbi:hypothetical protein FA95DRAFT_1490240, partial [Auriscalpium vulgare]